MNGMILAVHLALTLFLIEGIWTLFRGAQPLHNRSLALLSLFIALLTAYFFFLAFWRGELVFGPEFGIVLIEDQTYSWMQQGIGRLQLWVFIAFIIFAVGGGWHLARSWAGWPNRKWWLRVVSL